MNKRATWIRPVSLEGLLKEVLISLEGDSVVVLEGDSKLLPSNSGLKCPIPAEFKSEAPGAEVVALSLSKGNAAPVFQAIIDTQDWSKTIEAMQVLKRGQRAFLAGDSFDEECISVWPAAPSGLIEVLVSKHVASIL